MGPGSILALAYGPALPRAPRHFAAWDEFVRHLCWESYFLSCWKAEVPKAKRPHLTPFGFKNLTFDKNDSTQVVIHSRGNNVSSTCPRKSSPCKVF